MRGRIGDDPVPPRRAPVGAKPSNPLVKEPTETKVWRCSDNTTKTRLEDAQAHELQLAFNKLVRPYDMAGRHADQPIPLPTGMRDRDDLWNWIKDHGHEIFPWLGVYVATVPAPINAASIKTQEVLVR